MRAVAAVAALLLASACATTPSEQTLSANALAGQTVVATIATNSCQLETAPLYTAAVVEAQRAARALRTSQISIADAETVLTLGYRAKAALDIACADSATHADATQLDYAAAAVGSMRAILGGAR